MRLNINEMVGGTHHEHNVSKVSVAGKRDGATQSHKETVKMSDTVSTSSWARIASGALRSMRDEGQSFRQEKVAQFKFLAKESAGGKSALTTDEMADSVFSRMFG